MIDPKEIERLVELSEKATQREWDAREYEAALFRMCVSPMPDKAPPSYDGYTLPNTQFFCALVNLFRAHHAELAQAVQGQKEWDEVHHAVLMKYDQAKNALNQTVWRERAQFPDDPYCVLCGAGKKWSEEHGHQQGCVLHTSIDAKLREAAAPGSEAEKEK